MSKDQDQIFFRNYSVVISLLALMIVIFLVVARMVGMNEQSYSEQRADIIASRTAPVGEVSVTGQEQTQPEPSPPASAATAGQKTVDTVTDGEADAGDEAGMGKRVYTSLCFSCHGTGLPGIPQTGDGESWQERLAKGKETMYQNAINGFTGSSGIMMPARGGNPALTDEEVMAAVDYMISRSQ